MMSALHEGHLGVVRMKALTWSYVWWLKIDTQIEDWVKRCQPCKESCSAPPKATPGEWELA